MSSAFSNPSLSPLNSNTSSPTKNASIYVFLPVQDYIKISFAFLTISICIFGVIANTFALVYKIQDFIAKKTQIQVAFRRDVACYLMISLSSSDIITALIGGIMLTVNFLADVFQTQLPCKINRSILIFLAIVSVNNLLVISLEQYFGIFYWTRLPSPSQIRWGILVIWVEAFLASWVSFLFNDSVKVDLDNHRYTLICSINSDLPLSKESFFAVFAISYLIPICFVSYAAVSTLRHIRASKMNIKCATIMKQQQFKNARLFINIFAGFLIPYSVIILYHVYRLLSQQKFIFETEYVLRYIGTLLTISNCIINPGIYISRCKGFRKKLRLSLGLNAISFNATNLVSTDPTLGISAIANISTCRRTAIVN